MRKKKHRKFKVGDVVTMTDGIGRIIVIKRISPCSLFNGMYTSCKWSIICPGHINGLCFGFSDYFSLELATLVNCSKIYIKK